MKGLWDLEERHEGVGEAECLGNAEPLQMAAMQCEKKEEETELEREGETSTPSELWTVS